MGLSHNLGKRIGASYGVPHGYTSCATLAPTLDLVGERVPSERWEMLKDALGGEPSERVAALVRELGLPSRLSEVGVPEGDLNAIAEEFGEQAANAREILTRAL
jgi:alcohol dehydrogenase class IV